MARNHQIIMTRPEISNKDSLDRFEPLLPANCGCSLSHWGLESPPQYSPSAQLTVFHLDGLFFIFIATKLT